MSVIPQIRVLGEDETLESFISTPKLTAVSFVASWSENCQSTKDMSQELISDAKYSLVQFLQVEAEDHPDLSGKYIIKSVPQVLFFKNGKEIARVQGANPRQYLQLVNQHKALDEDDGGMLPPLVERPVTAPSDNDDPGVIASMALTQRLDSLINQSKVMLFMKGNPDEPKCGFSRRMVALLEEAGIEFGSFDILEDEEVRQGLKTHSDWQTYPQLYIDGELMGGLDVVVQMRADGSLIEMLVPTND